MKKIEDYLHLYLGCQVMLWTKADNPSFKTEQVKLIAENARTPFEISLALAISLCAKPILRPLSDMTEEEMIEIIQISVPDNIDGKPTAEDYDLDLFYNDSGNMVDDDVVIGANYSCICYVGQIAIRKCGTIHFFDEDGEMENFYNMPKVYLFLLSKHFDLFNLVPEGLAIDRSTLK